MSEDGDYARSQARLHGMGVRTAFVLPTVYPGVLLTAVAPFTDDPLVPIVLVMGISGVLMLWCLVGTLVKKYRQAKRDGKM